MLSKKKILLGVLAISSVVGATVFAAELRMAWLKLKETVAGAAPKTSTPYGGVPYPVPGSYFMHAFNNGGEGGAYHDDTPSNLGGLFRPSEGVDIYSCTTGACNSYIVGSINGGEWLEYSINVSGANAGLYEVRLDVARTVTGNASYRIRLDGIDVTGPVAVPVTGGTNTLVDTLKSGIYIGSGAHIVRFEAIDGTFRANRMQFIRLTQQPHPVTPWALSSSPTTPVTIEAERYDNGGQNVSYYDTTTGNAGGVYRTNDVDIQAIAGAGNGYVVNAMTNEWLEYSIVVPTTGLYTFGFRAATWNTQPIVRAEIDGVNITGAVTLPQTGSLTAFQTTNKTGVQLTAGTWVLRVHAQSASFLNLDSLTITKQNELPTVSLTSPASGSWFDSTNPICLSATASDPDGAIQKVEFFRNGLKVGEDTSATLAPPAAPKYDIPCSALMAGAYSLTAVATDNSNGTTISSVRTITVTIPSQPFIGAGSVVPGFVEAEDYDTGSEGVAYHEVMTGTSINNYRGGDDVDVGSCYEVACGHKLIDVMYGEWARYTLDVRKTGNYAIKARFTNWSAFSGDQFRIEIDGIDVTGNVAVPQTYGHESWQTVTFPANGRPSIYLSAGRHVMRFVSSGDEFDVNWFEFVGATLPFNSPAPQFPSDQPRIEAENFDIGGEGYGYHDLTSENDGAAYRAGGVDIYPGASLSNGYRVGAIQTGEWLTYTVSASVPGQYKLVMRSGSVAAGASLRLDINGVNTTIAVPTTGSEEVLQTTSTTVTLPAGPVWFTLWGLAGTTSVDWFEIQPLTQQPYGGVVHQLPGRIRAEQYDRGGEGIAYFDSDDINTGGSLVRRDGVDLALCSEYQCGTGVSQIQPNEWLEYTVNVATAGDYTFRGRVSSADTTNWERQFRILVDGVDILAGQTEGRSVLSADTGGPYEWRSERVDLVPLTAGQHVVRFEAITGGHQLHWLEFTPVEPEGAVRSVRISSPANGATAAPPGNFPITVAADSLAPPWTTLDNFTVYVGPGTAAECSSTTEATTYTCTTTEALQPGTYSAVAVATEGGEQDLASNRMQSDSVALEVKPGPPGLTLGITAPALATAPATITWRLARNDEYGQIKKIHVMRTWNRPLGGAITYYTPIYITQNVNWPLVGTLDPADNPLTGGQSKHEQGSHTYCARGLDAQDRVIVNSNCFTVWVQPGFSVVISTAFPTDPGAGATTPPSVLPGGDLRIKATVSYHTLVSALNPIDHVVFMETHEPTNHTGNVINWTYENEGRVTTPSSPNTYETTWTVPANRLPGLHYLRVWAVRNASSAYSTAFQIHIGQAPSDPPPPPPPPTPGEIGDAPIGALTPTYSSSGVLVGAVPMETGVSGGAATASIPIEVPPGRHGMQPSLSLEYSSRAGNGIAGMGWSLSGTSSIHRCPRTVEQDAYSAPVDFSSNDKLCIDGQRLVRVAGAAYGQSGAVYKTEVDSQMRVTQIGDIAGVGAFFFAELKSGEMRTYGSGNSASDVDMIDSSTRILSWNLSRSEDRAGNSVDYSYGSRGSGEQVLENVTYTNSATQSGDRVVEFEYEDRPASGETGANDRGTTYLSGARIQQTVRLAQITTKIAGQPVRAYELNYDDPALGTGPSGTSEYSRRSLLRSVKLCAYETGGSVPSCLPRTVFEWQESLPQRPFGTLIGSQVPIDAAQVSYDLVNPPGSGEVSFDEYASNPPPEPITLDPGSLGALAKVGDLDGDGVVEMLATAGRWNTTTNKYEYDTYLTKFNADRTLVGNPFRVPAEWVLSLSVAGHAADVDNDGRVEIWSYKTVVAPVDPTDPGLYPFSSTIQFHRFDPNAAGTWDQGSFETVDTGIWANTGRKYLVTEGATEYVYSSGAVHLADVNGDGLPDLIVARTPWGDGVDGGAHDPLRDLCPSDNEGVGGDVLLVYVNRSSGGAIAFGQGTGTSRTHDYFECFESNPGPTVGFDNRRVYARLGGVNDINGDGMPDLSIQFEGIGVRFGRGQPGGGTGNALTQLFPLELRVEEFADTYDWESTTLNVDVNGDGLRDSFYRAYCDIDGSSGRAYAEFVRLNTGKALERKVLSDRIRVDGGSQLLDLDDCDPHGIPVPAGARPKFEFASDLDGDGREELLRPVDFAARICTFARYRDPESSPTNPVYAAAYFCPEHPTATVSLVPQSWTEGLEALIWPMYGPPNIPSHGKFDDSLYKLGALKFVDLGPDSNGNPRFVTTFATDTGVVSRAGGGIVADDLYGDGLSDHYGVFGCRFASTAGSGCEVLHEFSDTQPEVPSCGNLQSCTWGPTALPNGELIDPSQRRFFISENVGVGALAQRAPLLPDMLRTASSLRGDNATVAHKTTWDYSPLSGNAGREPDELKLYSIPARASGTGYVDTKHFYFTSSMPVVARMTKTAGETNRDTDYSYQEAMYHNQGRGFRGFRKIIEQDWTSGLRTTTRFAQKFPLTSATECQALSIAEVDDYEDCVVNGSGAPISLATTNWEQLNCDATACPLDPAKPVVVRPVSSERQSFDLATRVRTHRVQETTTYDGPEYSNVAVASVVETDYVLDDGGVAQSAVTRNRTSTYTYESPDTDPFEWWVDRLRSTVSTESVAYQAPMTPLAGASVPLTHASARTTVVGWDLATRQVNCKATLAGGVVSPPDCASAASHPSWESSSVTEFDPSAFGNPTRTTTSARGAIAPRGVTIGYGASGGYFPNTTTRNTLSSSIDYDARFGKPTAATDELGNTTRTTYDVLGREVEVAAPHVTDTIRSAPAVWVARQWCNPTDCTDSRMLHRTVTEQTGSPTRFEYFDAAGNAIRTEREGFADQSRVATTRTFDDRGLMTGETSPEYLPATGALTTFTHDLLGRVTRKHVQKNDLSAFTASPYGDTFTLYAYPGLRTDISVCRQLNAGGTCVQYGSEPILSMSRISTSDGKLLRTVDAHGGTTSFWYDGMGNAAAIQDAKQAITRASYDNLGRRTSSADPSRGDWAFAYNGWGELTSQTDARGLTTTFVRDELGRVEQRYWREPDQYDPALSRCMTDTSEYDDAIGGVLVKETRERVASLPSPGVCTLDAQRTEQLVRTYYRKDSLDNPDLYKRVVRTTTEISVAQVGAPLRQEAFLREVRYDGFYGRVKQEILPNAVSIYREYNTRGFERTVGYAHEYFGYENASNGYLKRVESMTPRDQPIEVVHADGAHRLLSRYDSSTGWMLETCGQLDQVPCNQPALLPNGLNDKPMDIAYRYDAFGNVIAQTLFGQRPPEQGVAVLYPITESYTYDALHRLENSSIVNNSQPGTVDYRYDAIGNLLRKTDYSDQPTGSGVEPYEYNYVGRPHQVSRVRTPGGNVSYAYDANGNVTDRTGGAGLPLLTRYDVDNLPLATLEDSAYGMYFRYGPNGQRYFQRSNAVGQRGSETFYLDKTYEKEKFTDGVLEERYYLTEGVMYLKDNRSTGSRTGTYYVYGDRLGSSIATVKGDGSFLVSSGTKDLRSYDAFGKPRGPSGASQPTLGTANSRGFTQHEHLDGLGLIHMNGRAYDQNLGRFLGVDPFIQFPSNSQSLNPYSYLMNSPLSGTDPSGYLQSICDHPSAAGGSSSCVSGMTTTAIATAVKDALAGGGLSYTRRNGGGTVNAKLPSTGNGGNQGVSIFGPETQRSDGKVAPSEIGRQSKGGGCGLSICNAITAAVFSSTADPTLDNEGGAPNASYWPALRKWQTRAKAALRAIDEQISIDPEAQIRLPAKDLMAIMTSQALTLMYAQSRFGDYEKLGLSAFHQKLKWAGDSVFISNYRGRSFLVEGGLPVSGEHLAETINYYYQGFLTAAARGSLTMMWTRIEAWNVRQAITRPSLHDVRQIQPAKQWANFGYDFYRSLEGG